MSDLFKFGDIVVNPWAGSRNPQKVLMVVRVTGRIINCLSLEGETCEYRKSDDLGFVKVGSIDMRDWQHMADLDQYKNMRPEKLDAGKGT
jgi:hypothetical protein